MGLFANWREKRRKLREEEELEQKRIEQKHRENIERWETENLNQYAGKVDGLILKKDDYCFPPDLRQILRSKGSVFQERQRLADRQPRPQDCALRKSRSPQGQH